VQLHAGELGEVEGMRREFEAVETCPCLIADYAHSEECRSVFIRRYFGEEYPPRCGTCDRCRADRVVAEHANPAPISRPKSGSRAQDRHQSPAKSGRRRRQRQRVHS
jgi:superfamily II DNA helicase RecQ